MEFAKHRFAEYLIGVDAHCNACVILKGLVAPLMMSKEWQIQQLDLFQRSKAVLKQV